MIEIEMVIGPKGQVVIPQVFRKAFKLTPGKKVIFKTLNDKLVIEVSPRDVVSIFKRTALKVKKLKKIHPHSAYNDELTERLG